MRTTNMFGAFLVGIAMVQGVPLRTDASTSLSHDQAPEHPSNLDSVAPSAPIDLKTGPGAGARILLDTRASSSSKSILPRPKVGTTSSHESTSLRTKLTGRKANASKAKAKAAKAKAAKAKASKAKAAKAKAAKAKAAKANAAKANESKANGSTSSNKTSNKSSESESSKSTAAQDTNDASTAQENQDVEGQDSLDPTTDTTAESSEGDTLQDSQDLPEDDAEDDTAAVSDESTEQVPQDLSEDDTEGLADDDSDENLEQDSQDLSEDDAEDDTSAASDENTEQDSRDLSEDDTEGLADDDSDDSGMESLGDADETALDQEISVTNHTATNFTLKLARTIRNDNKYKRSNLLFLRNAEEQDDQRNRDSRDAEADVAVGTRASNEADREGDEGQLMGDLHEKRGVNVASLKTLFQGFFKKLTDKGTEEVDSSVFDDSNEEDSDANTVALPEMGR